MRPPVQVLMAMRNFPVIYSIGEHFSTAGRFISEICLEVVRNSLRWRRLSRWNEPLFLFVEQGDVGWTKQRTKDYWLEKYQKSQKNIRKVRKYQKKSEKSIVSEKWNYGFNFSPVGCLLLKHRDRHVFPEIPSWPLVLFSCRVIFLLQFRYHLLF